MPELPDLTVYRETLERLTVGQRLVKVRLVSPFLLRTAEPSLGEVEGGTVVKVSRIGKRLILAVTSELFLVIHLMIAGRLHWRKTASKIPGKTGSAAFDFTPGTLVLTEAGSKKRASLHVVRGRTCPESVCDGRDRTIGGRSRVVSLCADPREPYTQTLVDRSAPLQRSRQCVLR